MPPGALDCSFMLAVFVPVISVLSKTTPTLNGVEEAAKKMKIFETAMKKKIHPHLKGHFERVKPIFRILPVSWADTMLMLT